ncbi:unnamed protein product [Gadus morhua 'NCC']
MEVMKVVVEVLVVEEMVLVILTLEVVLVVFEAGNGAWQGAFRHGFEPPLPLTALHRFSPLSPSAPHNTSRFTLRTPPARHSALDPVIATRGTPWHGLTHRCHGPASGGNLGLGEGWLAAGNAWGCPCSRVPCSEGKRIGHSLNHNSAVAVAT